LLAPDANAAERVIFRKKCKLGFDKKNKLLPNCNMLMTYAFYALLGGNLVALFVSLRAIARVRRLAKADLDWEQVAELTGDVGTCKRQIQKLNNRLNGMEGSSRASVELNELLAQLPPQQAPVPNGQTGG
jgi:hypothetical protein